MDNNAVAERIKFLMKELNYRQVDFAQKIDIDTSNLSKYLNGHMPLSDSFLNRLVVNLGVSKEWLLEGKECFIDGNDVEFSMLDEVLHDNIRLTATR